MKKKPITIGCLIAAGVLAILILNPIGCSILGVFMGMGHIRKMESAMASPRVYEPVGQRLALYCQSDQSLFPGYMGYAWLPRELNALGDGWTSVNADSAHVEMGGGFHHFGYNLVLHPETSTTGTNVWELYLYSEGSRDRHLQTIPVPVSERLTPDALVQKVVEGFEERLSKKPEDERAHQGKIQTYLRFNKVAEARRACADMLKAMPDNWWAVLVNALLADEYSLGHGKELITEWVKKDENFFRYMDLAYFCLLTGQPREAAQAIVKATEFNASTMWGEGGNSEFRGYTVAMCAYRAGNYDAVIALCDHLLPVRINGDYAKGGLRELKEASQKAKEGNAPDVTWASGILPFDPFEDVDIDKLLGRTVNRPAKDKK